LRFADAKVQHRNEIVATDTLFPAGPAHDDGILGHGEVVTVRCIVEQLVTPVLEFPGRLIDFIRKIGAPSAFSSENVKGPHQEDYSITHVFL
jgi:hypothetical protein